MTFACVSNTSVDDERRFSPVPFEPRLIGPPLTPSDCIRLFGRIDAIGASSCARIRMDLEHGKIYFSPGDGPRDVFGPGTNVGRIDEFDFTAGAENADDLWDADVGAKAIPKAAKPPLAHPPQIKASTSSNNRVAPQNVPQGEPPKPDEKFQELDEEELMKRRRERAKKAKVEETFDEFDDMNEIIKAKHEQAVAAAAAESEGKVHWPRRPGSASVESKPSIIKAQDSGVESAADPEDKRKAAVSKWSQFAQVKDFHPALSDKVVGSGGLHRAGFNYIPGGAALLGEVNSAPAREVALSELPEFVRKLFAEASKGQDATNTEQPSAPNYASASNDTTPQAGSKAPMKLTDGAMRHIHGSLGIPPKPVTPPKVDPRTLPDVHKYDSDWDAETTSKPTPSVGNDTPTAPVASRPRSKQDPRHLPDVHMYDNEWDSDTPSSKTNRSSEPSTSQRPATRPSKPQAPTSKSATRPSNDSMAGRPPPAPSAPVIVQKSAPTTDIRVHPDLHKYDSDWDDAPIRPAAPNTTRAITGPAKPAANAKGSARPAAAAVTQKTVRPPAARAPADKPVASDPSSLPNKSLKPNGASKPLQTHARLPPQVDQFEDEWDKPLPGMSGTPARVVTVTPKAPGNANSAPARAATVTPKPSEPIQESKLTPRSQSTNQRATSTVSEAALKTLTAEVQLDLVDLVIERFIVLNARSLVPFLLKCSNNWNPAKMPSWWNDRDGMPRDKSERLSIIVLMCQKITEVLSDLKIMLQVYGDKRKIALETAQRLAQLVARIRQRNMCMTNQALQKPYLSVKEVQAGIKDSDVLWQVNMITGAGGDVGAALDIMLVAEFKAHSNMAAAQISLWNKVLDNVNIVTIKGSSDIAPAPSTVQQAASLVTAAQRPQAALSAREAAAVALAARIANQTKATAAAAAATAVSPSVTSVTSTVESIAVASSTGAQQRPPASATGQQPQAANANVAAPRNIKFKFGEKLPQLIITEHDNVLAKVNEYARENRLAAKIGMIWDVVNQEVSRRWGRS
ncbi:hypothetical protein HDV05_006995 [Chytridiales sp. JEL 0842]|nr:hypothetical protein HDV05_006995 [Chytridiales sp. JEL 0842]